MLRRLVPWTSMIAVLATLACEAKACEAGQYESRGRLVRAVDGDTIVVVSTPWPDLNIGAHVRLLGIDAEELGNSDAAKRKQAWAAKAYVEEKLAKPFILCVTKLDSFGRYLADVLLPNGKSLAGGLLEQGLAHPYRPR